MAPPPSSVSWPVERPCVKVMFWTVSVGCAWSWQWAVVQTRSGSQVFMYRIRRAPPPSSVTSPLPSMTTSGRSLNTLAVACIMMVTGLEPHLNRMMPPRATAATTLLEVQLAAVPLPMT